MSTRSVHDAIALHGALYALGCLGGDEAAQLEAHLATCAACEEATRELEAAAAALASLVPEAAPPADLKARLFERVGAARPDAAAPPPAQSWKQWAASSTTGPVFVPAGATGWASTGVPGVVAKGLFVDPENDRVTMLVRMAPGSSYPAHRHGGAEECFLLEGDLDDGEICMHAGDYLRKDRGTVHGVQSSEQGCLMLIVSSLHDELVAAAPMA